jgi:hypothetical protein
LLGGGDDDEDMKSEEDGWARDGTEP